MDNYYRKTIDNLNAIMADLMVSQSDLIISDLRKAGYNLVEAKEGCAFGTVEFNGTKYQYNAKSCSFIHNPLDLVGFLAEPSAWNDVIKTITQCVPNKADYLICMYAPIVLEYESQVIRFAAYFDVIKVK